MSCNCKDDNGEYLSACLGTCSPVVQNLSDERIKDLFNQIRHLINEFHAKQNQHYKGYFRQVSANLYARVGTGIDARYKEGFADGFKMGLSMQKTVKSDE